jgi:glycosyltransferase involved in cell wall biosynthesis
MTPTTPTPARRVLYIHANNDEVGGADYCLFKMAREVRSIGWEPIVLLRRRTAVVDLYDRDGISVLIAVQPRLSKTINPLALAGYGVRLLGAFVRMRRLIARERIALVHTNDLLDFVGNLAARSLGVPSCQHVRMIVTSPGWLARTLGAIAAHASTRVMCVSKGVLQTMFPGAPPNVGVLHDWLDMEAVGHVAPTPSARTLHEELGLRPGTRSVGCVGRLEPWKGQHVFVSAAEAVASRRPDIHFVVVGGMTTNKEAYANEVTNQRERSLFRDRISLLGHRTDVDALMRQLDVLVHSSVLPDPFPGVVTEGLMTGTIVVAARAGGVTEQVTDGVTGFLYEPGNVNDMAAAIERALDLSDRDAMSARARQEALARFGKQELVEQLRRVYDDLSPA